MIKPEDQVHLRNIAQSITEIDAYVAGKDYQAFADNEQTRLQVARELQAMGEAAELLTPAFRDSYGQIDYAVLETLKNTRYNVEMEMDHRALWHIIQHDLPIIRDEVLTLNQQAQNEPGTEKDIRGFRDLG